MLRYARYLSVLLAAISFAALLAEDGPIWP